MTGLNLIQQYSSDTDEEDEELNNENEASLNVNKTNIKLPLPTSILSLKGVLHHEEVVDNPLEHEGRVRSFKHTRGNWATLIYIDYILSSDMLIWMKKAVTMTSEAGCEKNY